MAWATHKDLTDAWIGDDAPEDANKVGLWLKKAEREVVRLVPDINERIEAEGAQQPAVTTLKDLAVDVVVEMVTRVFLNPKRQRTVSEAVTTGPTSDSVSVTMGGDSPGKLYLAEDELEKLRPKVERGAAYEIDLFPKQQESGRPWPL